MCAHSCALESDMIILKYPSTYTTKTTEYKIAAWHIHTNVYTAG